MTLKFNKETLLSLSTADTNQAQGGIPLLTRVCTSADNYTMCCVTYKPQCASRGPNICPEW